MSLNEYLCEEHGEQTSVSVLNENNASPRAQGIGDVNNNVDTMNENSSFIGNGVPEAESSLHVDSSHGNVDDATALTAAASSQHVDPPERNADNGMSFSVAVGVRDGIDNDNNVTTDVAEDKKRAAIGKKVVHGFDIFAGLCANEYSSDFTEYEGLLTPEDFNMMDVQIAIRNKEKAAGNNNVTQSNDPTSSGVATVTPESANARNTTVDDNVARQLEPTMRALPYGSSVESSSETEAPLAFEYILMSEHARVPTQATSGSAGFDLYSPCEVTIPPHETVFIDLNIQLKPPFRYYGKVDLRTSMALRGLSSPAGTIDPDYTGPIHMLIRNHTSEEYHVHKHDRIGQVIFQRICIPVPKEVSSFEPTSRGSNRFGSTGL
jgi:dUTP pyrophosphatase